MTILTFKKLCFSFICGLITLLFFRWVENESADINRNEGGSNKFKSDNFLKKTLSLKKDNDNLTINYIDESFFKATSHDENAVANQYDQNQTKSNESINIIKDCVEEVISVPQIQNEKYLEFKKKEKIPKNVNIELNHEIFEEQIFKHNWIILM
jgi:hypothetical protein